MRITELNDFDSTIPAGSLEFQNRAAIISRNNMTHRLPWPEEETIKNSPRRTYLDGIHVRRLIVVVN